MIALEEPLQSHIAADLDASPGLIVGLILILTAIAVFNPYARGMMKFHLSKLLWAAAALGTVALCGWGYLSAYFV